MKSIPVVAAVVVAVVIVVSSLFALVAAGSTNVVLSYARSGSAHVWSQNDGIGAGVQSNKELLQQQGYDWGDAPMPYPQLAHHDLSTVPGLYLGSDVPPDAEPAAQPDLAALGDDLNGIPDEDGVAFIEPLVPCGDSTLVVHASQAGVLNAWIDFTGDGDWTDAQPNEHVYADSSVTAGANALALSVPCDAVPGTTFARFRLSQTGGQNASDEPQQSAPPGEIEDHMVEVHPGADLAVHLSDFPDPVLKGTHLTYTLAIENRGPSVSSEVVVTHTYNADNLSLVSVTPEIGAPCDTNTQGLVVCSLGDLGVGPETEIHVVTSVDSNPAYEAVTATAQIRASTPDPDPTNNDATEATTIIAGNLAQDFGDAPDVYEQGTWESASHTINQQLRLGASIDPEGVAHSSAWSDGDDLHNMPDEDGVQFGGPLLPGGQSAVTITASAAGYISVWVDFNTDSQFWSYSEAVARKQAIGAGTSTITFTVPTWTQAGLSHARFRFSDDERGVASPRGRLSGDWPLYDGEIEDHLVWLGAPPAHVDLLLEKSDKYDPSTHGERLTYDLHVLNTSWLAATSIALTDTLPSEVVYEGELLAPDGELCTYQPPPLHSLECSQLPDLGFGESFDVSVETSVSISVPLGAAAVITNTSGVSSSGAEPDPDPNSNVDVEETRVVHPCSADKVLVFDTSGSMRSEFPSGEMLLDVGKTGGVRLVEILELDEPPGNPKHTAGVVSFEESAVLNHPLSTDRGSLTDVINGLEAITGTMTNMADGIDTAHAELAAGGREHALPEMIIITDGGPTHPPPLEQAKALAMASANAAKADGVRIWVLGIKIRAHWQAYMQQIASPGRFFNVLDPDDLYDVIDTIGENNCGNMTVVSADLEVVKQDAGAVASCENITYTVNVTNHGPAAARKAVLTDTLLTQSPGFSGIVTAVVDGGAPCDITYPLAVCELGDLAPGGVATATVVASLNNNAPASVVNKVEVQSRSPEVPNVYANVATVTTAIVGGDMSVAKSDTPDPVTAGHGLTYTVVATNEGRCNEIAVITDSLPVSFTVRGHESKPGYTALSPDRTVITASLGTLAPGRSGVMTVTGLVDCGAPEVIMNTAYVSRTLRETGYGNNKTVVTTTVRQDNDLGIVKSAQPVTVVAGTGITYSLTATNDGVCPQAAQVQDFLPSALSVTGHEASKGSTAYLTATHSITASPGTLGVGIDESVSITITGELDCAFAGSVSGPVPCDFADVITNTAVITGSLHESNLGNNRATLVSPAVRQADLAIAKTDDPDPAELDEPLSYVLTVTNAGPSAVDHVLVTDTLPAAVEYVTSTTSISGTFCSYSAPHHRVSCDLGAMTCPTSTAQVTITVSVDEMCSGQLVNEAEVGECGDPDPGNNTAVEITDCPLASDLGDAPDSTNHHASQMFAYPLVLADYPTVFDYMTGLPVGPSHLEAATDIILGGSVSGEHDADLPPDEDGATNLEPLLGLSDQDASDDGVDGGALQLPVCAQAGFDYVVTVRKAWQPRYFNAWFDFNRDGDWNDSYTCMLGGVPYQVSEWAVQDQLLVLNVGTHVVTSPGFISDDPPLPTRPMWARFMVSEAPSPIEGDGRGPVSGYLFGETEDYFLAGTSPAPPVYRANRLGLPAFSISDRSATAVPLRRCERASDAMAGPQRCPAQMW